MQRNKQVHLRELTDVVAVREDAGTRSGPSKNTPQETIHPEVPASQVQAFENDGWVFQQRSAREVPQGGPQAKVFVKSGGRLALGTDLLTVQFPEERSEEEANAVLQPYGCRVAQRLTFAPGLFQVTCTDQARGDIVDVANQLADSGLVKFAEPELLEASGPRSS